MKKTVFAIALMTFVLPLPALAQSGAPAPTSWVAACAGDMNVICPGMAPAAQRKCMLANVHRASQQCGTAIANARSENRVMHDACSADIARFCPNLPMGPQRHSCVVANRPSFSAECQSAMDTRQQPH